MPYLTSTIGEITAGDLQVIGRPMVQATNPRYPLLIMHGAGGSADLQGNYGNSTVTYNSLTDGYGITCVAGDIGGKQTWGNTLAMNAIDDAFLWLQNQSSVKKGKIALAGGSMGALNALVWAASNPEKVSCLSLYIPVLNLTDIWSNNRGGFTTIINSCYGGAYVPAMMEGFKSPFVIADGPVYKNIPILINYGKNDTLCLPEYAVQFAAKVSDNVTLIERNGGHDLATEGSIDRQYEIAFIEKYSQ